MNTDRMKERLCTFVARRQPLRIGSKWRKQARTFQYAMEAVGILMMVGFLFYDAVWAGLFYAPYVYLHIRSRTRSAHRKSVERLTLSFKDSMQSLSTSLSAGYSLENAVKEAVKELSVVHGEKDPCVIGLTRVVNQLSVNRPIEAAFMDFAKENEVEEIQYFAQVLATARRTGGNLIRIVRDTADMIRERIEVAGEILTMTTAKRFEQNIMNAIPILIILYMRFTSGSMIAKLYGNPIGIVTMTLCLGIYYAGVKLSEHMIGKVTT